VSDCEVAREAGHNRQVFVVRSSFRGDFLLYWHRGPFTLQHTVTRRKTPLRRLESSFRPVTHCNTLCHNTEHFCWHPNSLHYTGTHCNALSHNVAQWGRWTWGKIRPSPHMSVGSEFVGIPLNPQSNVRARSTEKQRRVKCFCTFCWLKILRMHFYVKFS